MPALMAAWTSCSATSMFSSRLNSRVMTEPPPELVGGHLLEARHLAELALKRSGHGGGHDLGPGAGVEGEYLDDGVVHLGQSGNRQLQEGDAARQHDGRHQQRGRDGAENERPGWTETHCCCLCFEDGLWSDLRWAPGWPRGVRPGWRRVPPDRQRAGLNSAARCPHRRAGPHRCPCLALTSGRCRDGLAGTEAFRAIDNYLALRVRDRYQGWCSGLPPGPPSRAASVRPARLCRRR